MELFNNNFIDTTIGQDNKKILLTLQPSVSQNEEPLPNFLKDFISSNVSGIHLTVRIHPNDVNGREYCSKRLRDIPSDLYTISDGNSNLYDQLSTSTHHITAFSSCCYEATLFGVPTLLFGEDAKNIYSDEISKGVFTWTNGSSESLQSWLEITEHPQYNDLNINDKYIVSSLEFARKCISSIMHIEDYRKLPSSLRSLYSNNDEWAT